MNCHCRFTWWIAAAVFFFTLLPVSGGLAESYREGMVIQTTSVSSGPDAVRTVLATLSRGTRVKVFTQQGGRYLIGFTRNMETLTGWIDSSAVSVGGLVKPERDLSAVKVFPGVVTRSEVIRESPDVRAVARGTLENGEAVEIISRSGGWYRIRLAEDDGSFDEGWIEQSSVALGARPTAALKPPEHDDDEGDFQTGARFIAAPVFHLKSFGATQLRIGAAYDRRLSGAFLVSIPVTYSFLGGFSAISGGVEWHSRLASFANVEVFHAGTIDVGGGVRYRMTPRLEVTAEPFAVAVSPLVTQGLPWFVRGQSVISVRGWW